MAAPPGERGRVRLGSRGARNGSAGAGLPWLATARGRPGSANGPGGLMGRKPNAARRKKVAQLHAQCLEPAAIARRVGISRQWVYRLLNPTPRDFFVRCRECSADLPTAGAYLRDDGRVYCLDCLAKHPEAPFGEHLKAFRLAAGLHQAELADRAGIPRARLTIYERRHVSPP